MPAKALSDRVIEETLSAFNKYGTQGKAAAALGMSRATFQARLREARRKKPAFVCPNRPLTKTLFVITAAQNGTPIHKKFFAALLNYCKHRDAQLIVVPIRYTNPTSVFTDHEHDTWAAELVPYLRDQRIDLTPDLMLLGDIKVQPTATSPLGGLETLSGGSSAIVAHPKLELVSIPTPQHLLPKLLTTTGAVTVKNYTESKAGKKGEHHHTYGACVVETDDNLFFMRQINASRDGSFIDLVHRYDDAGVEPAGRALAVALGDLHERFVDPGVVAATFGPGGILPTLKPKVTAWHDVMDFHSRNHHHNGRPFLNLAKHKAGKLNVEAEVDECCAFVDRYGRKDSLQLFVPSNHPDALARWIEESDWRGDPENAQFYLETALIMARSAKMTDSGTSVVDPFSHWAKKKLKKAKAVFLRRDQSYQVGGIELGYHGDRGPNGSRGAIRGFGKIGTKTIIGHSHSPGIKDGAYQVGTSSRLDLDYASGPSSWLHAHAVVYANGKRSLLIVVNGRWRA